MVLNENQIRRIVGDVLKRMLNENTNGNIEIEDYFDVYEYDRVTGEVAGEKTVYITTADCSDPDDPKFYDDRNREYTLTDFTEDSTDELAGRIAMVNENKISDMFQKRKEKKLNKEVGNIGLPKRMLRIYAYKSLENGIIYMVYGRDGKAYMVSLTDQGFIVEPVDMPGLNTKIFKQMTDITPEVGVDTDPNEFFMKGEYANIPFSQKDVDYNI